MDSHPPHWVELFTSWRASPVYLALLGLAVVSCSVLASHLVLRIIYDPLAAFPGPPLARWTRWHSVRVVWSGREHELIQAAHEKYGSYPTLSDQTEAQLTLSRTGNTMAAESAAGQRSAIPADHLPLQGEQDPALQHVDDRS